jgi:LacI family transcriptional regulator
VTEQPPGPARPVTEGQRSGGQRAGGQRAARLIDIAAAVGVHPSTVSRVLNDGAGHSVRPETVRRIRAEARARGYRPNALARALRQHHTGALAFVVPMLRNPIWVRLQRGALLRAAERGYVVMITEEPLDRPMPPGMYRYLVAESRADGLLLATALRAGGAGEGSAGAGEGSAGAGEGSADAGSADAGSADAGSAAAGGQADAALTAVPHVYVNRRGPRRGNDVVMDEAGAVRLFLEHVAGLGHRSVLLVDGPSDIDTVHRRVLATRRYGAALGLRTVVRNAPPTEDGGFTAIGRLLAAGPLPTAIGVGSIDQVFGVLSALRRARVTVPGDVSVVSFDEDDYLAYLEVPVTAVCMPLAELGAAAVDALITRIDGGGGTDVLIKQPMALVARESVGPAPAR